jgi:filamentous hemagglutinin
LGDNAGSGQAASVSPGGSGQAVAGHGYYQYGSGDVTVPSSTSVITSPYGVKISDYTGQFLEGVDTAAFQNADAATRSQMARQWLQDQGITGNSAARVSSEVSNLQIMPSGGQLPNYTITPPTNLNILENSTTVQNRTSLQNILKPNAGCIALAICTEVKTP